MSKPKRVSTLAGDIMAVVIFLLMMVAFWSTRPR